MDSGRGHHEEDSGGVGSLILGEGGLTIKEGTRDTRCRLAERFRFANGDDENEIGEEADREKRDASRV